MNSCYKKVCNDSATFSESNDCAVKAISLLLSKDYADIHKRLKAYGRRDNRGTPWGALLCTLKSYGDKLRGPYEVWQKNGNRYTSKSLVRDYGQGRYLVCFKGHVAPLIDGKIMDWVSNRNNRVTCIYEIYKD